MSPVVPDVLFGSRVVVAPADGPALRSAPGREVCGPKSGPGGWTGAEKCAWQGSPWTKKWPQPLSRGTGYTNRSADVPTGYTNRPFVRPAGKVADAKVASAKGRREEVRPAGPSRTKTPQPHDPHKAISLHKRDYRTFPLFVRDITLLTLVGTVQVSASSDLWYSNGVPNVSSRNRP